MKGRRTELGFFLILPGRGKDSSQGGCNLQSRDWLLGVKIFWVRTRGPEKHCGDLVVDCLDDVESSKEDKVNESFAGQAEKTWCRHLHSLGPINYPDRKWLSAVTRTLLESANDSFLVQQIQKLASKGTLPDLLLTNKEEPSRVQLQQPSNWFELEFKILGEVRKTDCMAMMQDFRRAEFSLFTDLHCRMSLKTALESKVKAWES